MMFGDGMPTSKLMSPMAAALCWSTAAKDAGDDACTLGPASPAAAVMCCSVLTTEGGGDHGESGKCSTQARFASFTPRVTSSLAAHFRASGRLWDTPESPTAFGYPPPLATAVEPDAPLHSFLESAPLLE